MEKSLGEKIKERAKNATCKDCRYFGSRRANTRDKIFIVGACSANRMVGIVIPEYKCNYLILNNNIIEDLKKDSKNKKN